MRITELEFEDEFIHSQAAELLYGAFIDTAPKAWPTIVDALQEVHDSFGPGRMSLVARLGQKVIGWAGAVRQYNGNAWELHPLVVHKEHRFSGVGTALVAEIESQVIDRGGLTLYVGTDDEVGQTSLWGQELYPEPLRHLMQIVNLNGHPYEFYEKMGFTICGVLPDANGLGKPDIFLSKRVRKILP